MVNIRTTLCAENTCGLLIENTTGYYDSVNNPTGFLIPGNTSITLKDYHLNDVFLFTFLVKNNWDGTFTNIPISGNIGKNVTYSNTKTFATLMDEAEVTQHYSFSTDGFYSIYQFAIPKESIKLNVESAAAYTYYVKPDLTVWLDYAGTSTLVDLFSTLISCTTNWSNNNIVMLRSNMVSKCFLEDCLNVILEVFSKYYTDPLCIKDSQKLQGIREKRDLLFSITNTIQYYVELGQYYKAAKLIADISYCNICQDYISTTVSTNCNCHS